MSGGREIVTTMQAYDIAAFRALLTAYENERDFSEWLTGLVAGVAARVGGPYELTAGRSGSWESARIIEWMQSAGCEIPEEVEHLRERWAPADPEVTATLPQQITGEQREPAGPERTTTEQRPVTFAEARDDVGPHDALTRLADHGLTRFAEKRAGDVVAHLEEVALMSAVAHWWGERWRPGSMHAALIHGASVDQVTSARGADVATVAAEWRKWADGQRHLHAAMEARRDKPIGITSEEYARVARLLGLDTADPARTVNTVQLPEQINGQQGEPAGPERTVTLDVTDDDAYYVLTDALEEWAHQRRCDAEDELATDYPQEWQVAHCQHMAAIADAMLERINADT